MKFTEITIDDLQECMDECPKGKRTQQNMKALCGLLYKYAIPRNLTGLNMGQYLTVGGESNPEKDALPEDVVSAIAASHAPFSDYVLCQCYLGFRPSELLALDVENYNPEEKAFTGGAKTEAGKGRTVTVSPKIQPIIDRLIADKTTGPVFCDIDGNRLSAFRYRELFYSVLDFCGVDNPMVGEGDARRHKYTPHSCRHTFATMMKRVQGSDKDKLELIGHTSDTMLRHYQDVSFDDLRRITDAL
jgi:integrase